jgi:CheY-like chemotaxis protein
MGWLRELILPELLAIMVVENDPEIQMLIDEALRDGGYDPALSASAEEAVTLLRGNQHHYRALITDINLKGTIDGWEIARRIREIDPAFPIIYMTGAAADQWPSQGVPNSILLTKPFAPAQLVTAISQLLNAGSPPIAPAG